jgi:hypothetical protein
MLRDASDLLGSVGFGSTAEPWLRLGIGLDIGRAFVGNVGAGDVKDFTALGDVVNTAARLQASAEAGQIVMSERLFARLPSRGIEVSSKILAIRGKHEPEPVRVIDLGPGASNGSQGRRHTPCCSRATKRACPHPRARPPQRNESRNPRRWRRPPASTHSISFRTDSTRRVAVGSCVPLSIRNSRPPLLRRAAWKSHDVAARACCCPSARRARTSGVGTTPDVKDQRAAINRCR